jgi:glyoxylase-like metal-dependent hydrolase (beta-lactamase superfamily II)
MGLHVETFLANNPFLQVFNYLIVDEQRGEVVFVDPAWKKSTVMKWLKSKGYQPVSILVTHHHYDHTRLATSYAKRFNIPIYLSRAEAEYYNVCWKNLELFNDRSPIRFGDSDIIPYLTPGHTKGSACFLAGKALFTGDTLFVTGCGATPPAQGGDPAEMFASLQLIKNSFAPDTLIYPAHPYGQSCGLTLAEVITKNRYLMLENGEIFISFRMQRGNRDVF